MQVDILYGQNQNVPTYCPLLESEFAVIFKNGHTVYPYQKKKTTARDEYAAVFGK